MFNQLKDTILRNDYIRYLEHLDIDTSEIINNIRIKIEKNKNNFDTFTNRSYKMLSPNVLLENIVFVEVNKYLYKNFQ